MRTSCLLFLLSAALHADAQFTLAEIGRHNSGVFNKSAAEIPAYCPDTKRLFVVNAHSGSLDVLDLTDPDTPASALYTAEFFSSVKNLLNPGGAMVLHTASPIFRPDVVSLLYQRLKNNFNIVAPMGLYIPLYGTYWSFAVCSNDLDPRTVDANQIAGVITSAGLTDLNYYNPATHQGLFALPGYFRKLIA